MRCALARARCRPSRNAGARVAAFHAASPPKRHLPPTAAIALVLIVRGFCVQDLSARGFQSSRDQSCDGRGGDAARRSRHESTAIRRSSLRRLSLAIAIASAFTVLATTVAPSPPRSRPLLCTVTIPTASLPDSRNGTPTSTPTFILPRFAAAASSGVCHGHAHDCSCPIILYVHVSMWDEVCWLVSMYGEGG